MRNLQSIDRVLRNKSHSIILELTHPLAHICKRSFTSSEAIGHLFESVISDCQSTLKPGDAFVVLFHSTIAGEAISKTFRH